VSFKEFARLQALQFNLENEKIEVLKDASEKQSNLILLTGDSLSRLIKPVISLSVYDVINADSYNLAQLIDTGLNKRYDLKMSDAAIVSETTNLSLQKAMRIPDLTIGARYDKAGSYIHNYNAISLGFDLPFWNRNQGNIKISENKIEEDKAIKNQKELEVKSEITRAFARFIETDKLYKTSSDKFDNKYEKLFEGLADAYKAHTISLLEFVDYYETYKDSKNEFFKLLNNRLDAIEELNLATGSIIFK
jgi:cobalt-zinc-cadmium efflux system outer membrane protein